MSCKREPAVAYAFLVFAFLFTFIASPRAHADTYELYSFTDYSGAGSVHAIDTSGDVVFNNALCYGLPPGAGSCYSVFQPSTGTIYNTTQLSGLDFGTPKPCAPVSGEQDSSCNNGYEAYYDPDADAIFGGPAGDIQEIASHPDLASGLLLNQYGDIAWTDGALEENHLAYDITAHETPEPTTLTLLATGLAALTSFTRRKRPL